MQLSVLPREARVYRYMWCVCIHRYLYVCDCLIFFTNILLDDEDCDWDGGDCNQLCNNTCNIYESFSNGYCDSDCNNTYCSFDNGDCADIGNQTYCNQYSVDLNDTNPSLCQTDWINDAWFVKLYISTVFASFI